MASAVELVVTDLDGTLAAAKISCAVAGGAAAALAHADHLIGPPSSGGWAAILDLI
jgi:hypothetical protein